MSTQSTTVAIETPVGKQVLLPPYPVVACVTVFFWTLFSRGLIYTIMPTIGADLDLSSTTAGAVIAVLLLGNCAGQWSGARLPSSRKARILAGTLLSVPAAVLFSRADSLWILLAAAPFLGFGTGVYMPVGISMIVEYAGANRGARYMAFHELVGTAGSFLGSTSVAFVLAWTDWHGAILAASLVGVVAALAFVPVRETRHASGSADGLQATRERVLLDSRLVLATIAQVSVAILLMGITSVLPLIMVRAWGLTQAEAATAVGYTRLAGLVGVLATGASANRWSHRKAILAFQSVSLSGIALMCVSGYGPFFLAGMALLQAGAVGTVCLLPLVISSAYAQPERESALGTVFGVGGLVGMVAAPALFGALVDFGFPTGPMQIAAAVGVASIVATRRILPRQT